MPCAAMRSAGPRANAGAWVVFGGIHPTLYPEEPFEHGGAHAVVKGDGDVIWSQVLRDCAARCAGAASTMAAKSMRRTSSRRAGI